MAFINLVSLEIASFFFPDLILSNLLFQYMSYLLELVSWINLIFLLPYENLPEIYLSPSSCKMSDKLQPFMDLLGIEQMKNIGFNS